MKLEPFTSLRVNGGRLRHSIESLSKIGRTPSGGISRFTFSESDLKARAYVTKLLVNSGMQISIDAFANIIGRLEARSGKKAAVVCGSHIDTVPNGGHLDGAYGVLAAIEVAKTINQEGIALERPLEVVMFTEEEGVRFPSFTGSLGFSGTLVPQAAHRLMDGQGMTFKQALKSAGFNPAELRPYHRNPRTAIKSYVEAHIEQGPTLELAHTEIGVVTKIVGLAELKVTIHGVAGHAGTTPMSMRRDALLGAAEFIATTNQIARATRGSVVTVGSVRVLPNASNVIPNWVVLGIDVRAQTSDKVRLLQNRIGRTGSQNWQSSSIAGSGGRCEFL